MCAMLFYVSNVVTRVKHCEINFSMVHHADNEDMLYQIAVTL